jgi:hypothetical protein
VQAPSVNHGIDSNSEPPPPREPACSPPSITYMAKRNTNSVLPSVPVCRQISDGQVQWDPSDDPPTLLPPIPTDPPCTQISDGQIQCRTTGQRATYLFEHQAAVATVVDNGNVPQNILYVREAPNVSNSPRVKILGFIWLGVCILLGTVLLMS